MRLAIVSHTPHYREGDVVLGLGSTVREIDRIATMFDEVVHVAPLHPGPPPESSAPYRSSTRLEPVSPAGGRTLPAKLAMALVLPRYALAIRTAISRADVVHVRCPANISFVALVVLLLMRRPRMRWVKYAGNWRPEERTPLSYRVQRWWLGKRLHRGIVTVNGRWPGQPSHVHTFENPSLTEDELSAAAPIARDKSIASPVELLFVGRVEEPKGVFTLFEVAERLRREEIPFRLTVVGEGPSSRELEHRAELRSLEDSIVFAGWLGRSELDRMYRRAHLLVLPSASEGWPKVVSEAMAHGAVPLVGAVSAMPEFLQRTGAGVALPPKEPERWVDAIRHLTGEGGAWGAHRDAGLAAAGGFTYEAYVDHLQEIFSSTWHIHLPSGRLSADT